MARVNVEQKALTDSRFGRLGLMLVNSEYPEITMDTAHALGLGRMAKVWNECQERCSYTLADHDLVVLLGNRNAPQILIECGLGEREKRGIVRIKGTTGRIEWLANKRLANQENGKKGGRPKKTHTEPTENHSGFPSETTPAPAPAPAQKKKTPSESQKKSAKDLVEGFAVDDAMREFARRHGQDADALLEPWRDHFRTTGYRTKTGPVADAAATMRTWIRNAQKFASAGAPLFRGTNTQPRLNPRRED